MSICLSYHNEHHLANGVRVCLVFKSIGTLRRPTGEADYSSLHEAYLAGVTMSLLSLEHFWAPVDHLCQVRSTVSIIATCSDDECASAFYE
eukprot:SAG31_NODE_1319_length_8817_cov_1.857077_15_plen_91_part_00